MQMWRQEDHRQRRGHDCRYALGTETQDLRI